MWPPRRVDGMLVRHPFTLASDRANRARTKINTKLVKLQKEGGLHLQQVTQAQESDEADEVQRVEGSPLQ
jgi:hypothetical protein